MRRRLRALSLILPTVALALFLAGCPKRPVQPVVAAPPPTPPPAPAPAPPPPPAPVAPAPVPVAPPVVTPPPPPPPKEFAANDNLKPIYFAFDKSDIRSGDRKVLDASADWLKANPNQLVLIEGHCDERGTTEYNLALGERRAKAAASHLTSRGVAADRISIVSYGKERPVCTEKNETCWSKNRFDAFLSKEK